jgi:hypothetical protein
MAIGAKLLKACLDAIRDAIRESSDCNLPGLGKQGIWITADFNLHIEDKNPRIERRHDDARLSEHLQHDAPFEPKQKLDS